MKFCLVFNLSSYNDGNLYKLKKKLFGMDYKFYIIKKHINNKVIFNVKTIYESIINVVSKSKFSKMVAKALIKQ